MLKAPDLVSPDEKREALDLVLRSRAFARSATLRALLGYICQMEMSGRESEISEYSIAVDGLGRSKMYSASEDSSVRNRVFALRKKLDEVYSTELAAQTVRIELTKGSYCPRFIRLASEHPLVSFPQPEAMSPPPPVPPIQARHSWPASAAVFASTLLLCAFAYFAFGVPRVDPVLRDAWGPLLSSNANVAIVLSMSPALAIRSYQKPPQAFDGVPIAEAPPYLYPWYSTRHPLSSGGKLFLLPTQTSPSMGSALGAASAAAFLTRAGASFEVLPETLMPMGATRNRNLILLGIPENSETLRRLLAATPFEVVFDPQLGDYSLTEHGGARRNFPSRRDPSGKLIEAYGLITVLPSEGSDGRRRSILLTGTYSAGIAAAMDFFCSPANMDEFRSFLRHDGWRTFPSTYQLVIKANTDHTLPLGSEYAAYRALK
jgi:hypothetical protein